MLMAVGARRSVSGPGAPSLCRDPVLCGGARRFVPGPGAPSECRGPALYASAPKALCHGPALLLSVGARRSVSGPGASSECRGPALFLSGPGTPCVGARRSLCRGSALSGVAVEARCASAKTLFRRSRRCVCRVPVLSVAVRVGAGARRSVSGPGALCVGARRSLCRCPALSVHFPDTGGLYWVWRLLSACRGPVCRRKAPGPGAPSECRDPALFSALCRGSALFVSGPALCVGAQRVFGVSEPGALCAALFASGPGALCVGARRFVSGPPSECRGPALFVSGPGDLCRECRGPALFVSGPGALCRGPALLASGPGTSSECRGPALFVSGPGAPCAVGARRSVHSSRHRQSVLGLALAVCLSRPNDLCVGARRFLGRRSLCRDPAVVSRRSFCWGRRSVSGPNALCVGARRFVSGPGAPSECRLLVSGPGASGRSRRSVCRAGALCRGLSGLGALCRGPALFVWEPGALCVGAPGLARGPALFVSGPALFVSGPALFLSGSGDLCQGVSGARIVSVSELGALRRSLSRGPLCVGARRSASACACCASGRGALCRGLALFVSGPALCVGAQLTLFVSGPGALCRGPALLASGPGAPSEC